MRKSIAQDMAYRQSLMQYAEEYGVSRASRMYNRRRRNPQFGLIELCLRLKQRGYRRESLFRAMRKLRMFLGEKKTC